MYNRALRVSGRRQESWAQPRAREFYYSTIPGAMLAAARAVVLTSVIRTLVKTMVKTVVQQPPGKTMVFPEVGLLV